MRVVLEVEDFDGALSFYRDALGLSLVGQFEGEGNARVAILDAGTATLELSNPAQTRMIDQIEVGHSVGAPFRIAFEVSDAESGTHRLVEAGAHLIAAPTLTPWNSLNSRLRSRDGIQLTLFQGLGETEIWTGETTR